MRQMQMKVKPGDRFGRLLVIEAATPNHRGDRYWLCRCDCGGERRVRESGLTHPTRGTKSCGCLNAEIARNTLTKHGMTHSSEYRTWHGMRSRCLNPKNTAFKNYGGRGIKVCDRWLESFDNFIEDVGRKPSPAHTLDRINNDGDYEPGNCRWATIKEQRNNTRFTTHLTFRGQTKPLHQWSDETGICPETIRRRLGLGWTVEKTLTQPPQKRRNKTTDSTPEE